MWTTLRVPHILTRQTNNNSLFKMKKEVPIQHYGKALIKQYYCKSISGLPYCCQSIAGRITKKCQRISGRVIGASGSWAEPYFACPTLRYGGFTYPPGIL
jgi:hypothetical protein